MPVKTLDLAVAERVSEWLEGPYDEATKREIRRLMVEDPKGLSEAFFKDLTFGTGGLRGVMGVGTNRVNIYTIRRATQGLANYIKKQENLSAFIGYDVRHNSRAFAEETASVLAGNGIQVFLTKEICPTPLVSFGCRYFGCQAAVMITASHNPPKYNGYKVYGQDGAQVVPPHDFGIMEEVAQVSEVQIAPLEPPLVHWVGEELDRAYLAEMKKLQMHPKLSCSSLKIIYSPLHGTGIRIIPKALKDWGYSSVSLVNKQSAPDGDFTNAPSPNPEEEKALRLGAKQLETEGGDIFIATDPDADRVGVVLRGEKMLTGNQVGCLMLHHICEALTEKGEFPPNGAFVKTIVTSELFTKIGKDYGGACVDVLTGFKYIGEKIAEWEQSFGGYQFLFGAEESYGYLCGTFVRDKDAISASCLIAEAAALAKKKKLTLYDRLCELYKKYGIHRESLTNLGFSDGRRGVEEMDALMRRLREKPPRQIGGIDVVAVEDYLSGKMSLPRSDVLRFWLKDESKLVIRPSGTEPKIKIYAEVVGHAKKEIDHDIAIVDERLQSLVAAFRQELP
jgi:phosphoglucomutase/phosphomannomutase